MGYIRYDDIQHLVDFAEREGSRARVFFKCARTGKVIEAHAIIPENFGQGLAREARDSTIRALLHRLSGLISRYTGIYIPISGAAAGRAPSDARAFVREADRHRAVEAAFETVAEYPGSERRSGRFNFIDGEWIYVE